MTPARRFLVLRLLLAALFLPFCCTMAQQKGSISGSVRTPDGSAAPGVVLTLSPDPASTDGQAAASRPAMAALHATTDAHGLFHFQGVAFSRFHIAIDQPGEVLSPLSVITLTAETPVLRLDLTLAHSSASAGSKPALQLQAAGIRGYIDPGGYSAPASAAAATDLIRGAASLNRSSPGAAVAAASSDCSTATRLLQSAQDHPDDPHASLALGQFYLAQGQPQQALEPLRRARQLDTSAPIVTTSLAEALLEDKQFQSAHDLLASSPAQPETAARHRLLARSEEGLGEFAQAASDYQAAAHLEPTEADFYGAGYELLLEGKPAAASRAFLDGAARYPGSTLLLMGVGTCTFLEGRAADATRIFLKAAALHPSDPRPYPFLLATSGVSNVELDAVEARFRDFYESSLSNPEAAYDYAMSLSRRAAGTASQAQVQALLEQAVRLKPDFAKAHVALGSVYLNQGAFDRAVAELLTATRLDPELSEARYRLSAAYRRAGDTQQADQQMQLFLEQKNRNTAGSETSHIDLDQFLSVFRQPDAPLAAQPSCIAHP